MAGKRYNLKACFLNPKTKFACFGMLLLLMSFAILFSGCSSESGLRTLIKDKLSGDYEMDAAVSVVDDFFKSLKSGDIDRAYEFISLKDKSNHNADEFKKELENVTEIVEVEINWVEVKSNIANVGLDLTDNYDGEKKVYKDLVVSLVKEEDGSWKINFWD